jgi:hypothetical protein
MGRTDVEGSVYLIHFDPPYRHAKHYLGWSERFTIRVAADMAGQGARLMAVALKAGSTFTLAATWPGTRALERRLKRCGGRARFCPICSPNPRRPRLPQPPPPDQEPPF